MNKFYKLNKCWVLTVCTGYAKPWGYKNENKYSPFSQGAQSLVRKTNR